MKLVDILARVLTEWPSGHPCQVASISQSLTDTELYFLDSQNNPLWGRYLTDQKAEDSGVPVTRAQWQAAVDALKAEAAPAWVGIGLPPVGTVCEHGRLIPGEWCVVEIVAHHRFKGCGFLSAVYVHDDVVRHASAGDHFRPIRTPKQIAAEERKKTIDDLKRVFDSISHELCPTSNQYLETLFGAIHDRGYRKFEIVDNDDGEQV